MSEANVRAGLFLASRFARTRSFFQFQLLIILYNLYVIHTISQRRQLQYIQRARDRGRQHNPSDMAPYRRLCMVQNLFRSALFDLLTSEPVNFIELF